MIRIQWKIIFHKIFFDSNWHGNKFKIENRWKKVIEIFFSSNFPFPKGIMLMNWIFNYNFLFNLFLTSDLWDFTFCAVWFGLEWDLREYDVWKQSQIYFKLGLINFHGFYPNRIELVFHTENSMKYQSLHTILKYRFNIPFRYEILIFCTWKIKFGMLKWYLRIVCKNRYFILFSVWNTNSILFGQWFYLVHISEKIGLWTILNNY